MLNRFWYLLKEGVKGVFSHGIRAFATVTIIVACLLIMGSFSLLSMNVDNTIKNLEQQCEVLAFVDETWTEESARSLEPYILAIDNVREVQFISRGEAMENYKAQQSDKSLFDDIDESVFRDRYVVYLDDITLMENTSTSLKALEGIADVNSYEGLEEGFVTVRNVVSVITVILNVILLVVSMFIIINTIKLATFTRREEIAIMRMVGATNGFIRFPFIVEGLVLGVLGGSIAFLLQWLIYNVLTEKLMSGLAGVLFKLIPFSTIFTPLLLVYLGVGVAVGALGGSVAIRNYLKV